MIHSAKDLSPDQKIVLEVLLGRPIAPEDSVSVRVEQPTPEWLQQSWQTARQLGVDALTPEEIDTEIEAARDARRTRAR